MLDYRSAVVFATFSLVACAAPRKPGAAPAEDSVVTLIAEPTQFLCQDSATFAVRFQDDSAFLSMPGDTLLILTRQPSASGLRYSDSSYAVLSKGDSAMLLMGDSILHGACGSTGKRG